MNEWNGKINRQNKKIILSLDYVSGFFLFLKMQASVFGKNENSIEKSLLKLDRDFPERVGKL